MHVSRASPAYANVLGVLHRVLGYTSITICNRYRRETRFTSLYPGISFFLSFFLLLPCRSPLFVQTVSNQFDIAGSMIITRDVLFLGVTPGVRPVSPQKRTRVTSEAYPVHFGRRVLLSSFSPLARKRRRSRAAFGDTRVDLSSFHNEPGIIYLKIRHGRIR